MLDITLSREDFSSEADWQRAITEGGVFEIVERRRAIREGLTMLSIGKMRVYVDPPGVIPLSDDATPSDFAGCVTYAPDAGERA